MTTAAAVWIALALAAMPEGRPGDEGIVLRRATSHPMRYFLAVPQGWRPDDGKRWPVLVCVTGSAGDFRQTAERFCAARGERPFFVVVPCSFSSSNQIRGDALERYRRLYSDAEIEQAGGLGIIPAKGRRLDWDEAGLLAILDDLRVSHGIADRVWLTGFSGGGHLTYRMIARHPDRLAGTIGVCANFDFVNDRYAGAVPPEERSLPIRVLTGGRDQLSRYRFGGAFLPSPVVLLSALLVLSVVVGYRSWRTGKRLRAVLVGVAGLLVGLLVMANHWAGISVQTDAAVGVLERLGFTNVERSEIPALGHEPTPERIFSTIPRSAK